MPSQERQEQMFGFSDYPFNESSLPSLSMKRRAQTPSKSEQKLQRQEAGNLETIATISIEWGLYSNDVYIINSGLHASASIS